MYTNLIFELSLVLDNEKFHKLLSRIDKRNKYLKEKEYIDLSLSLKGISVKYQDSQYKKKVKLLINTGLVMDGEKINSDKFVQKLDKQIRKYFAYKYQLHDFILSGVFLTADIDVHSRKNVTAYLKVLRRIGNVKKFSRLTYEYLDGVDSFCLEGNSNGVTFLLYDLEGIHRKQFKGNGTERKKEKTIIKESKGIIRAEVQLTKQKAIRDYVKTNNISGQIVKLLEKRQDIFLEIFVQVVPYGDFYKKDKAVETIRNEVKDIRLRRKMLRLLELIPEKRSLYLAQKAMNCRNMEEIMEAFEKIEVSPITISKRQDTKQLKNIYEYLLGRREVV